GWLELDWDGEPVSQASRAERHREAAEQMLEAGTAYRCYASAEEITAFREKARAEGRPPIFRSAWRDCDPAEQPDAPYTVRLRAPREGKVAIRDAVQGEVNWDADQLDDLILLRSDGTPTYMHAVVVDDHDMGITHVIRGDDHLTNAARQVLIYRALGWEPPVFAHVPLIHGPDGAKLSKRHGATSVIDYRDLGYLPAALRNYLARLGWSHGDEEFFTDEQAIAWFGLEAVGRSPARFDFAKLENLNGLHIRATDDAALLARVEELLEVQGRPALDATARARLLHAMPGLKERAKTLLEIIEMAHYILTTRPIQPDEKAARHLDSDMRAMLGRLTTRLAGDSEWQADSVEQIVRSFAEEEQLKLGKVAQPLRAALTGRSISPGVFDVIETLGREETLARLGDAAGRNAGGEAG
ncbi:MAG TPA: glutamate--tRNA ligase, partial [Paracoccaceae bacterium]|nr:glutamate--tRNA ligase [Paracoccaceae bacterium]